MSPPSLDSSVLLHCLQRKSKFFYLAFKALHTLELAHFFLSYFSLLPHKHLHSTQAGQASHSFTLAFCSLLPVPKMTSLHVLNFCHSLRPHSYATPCTKAFLRLLRERVSSLLKQITLL